MKRAIDAKPRRWVFGSAGFAALCLVVGCNTSGGTSTGGETHFLTLCVDEEGACGGEFDCVCNVCTLPCDAQNACGITAGAVCVEPRSASDACGVAVPAGHCEMRCDDDADCGGLSTEHRCLGGVCRTEVVEAPVDEGCPSGDVSANELLFIGDSFIAVDHQVTGYLEDLARSASVLTTGERYRDNSSLVGNTLALMGNGIAEQYSSAAAEAPVRVVVMNGGGADVLIADCEGELDGCALLTDAALAAEQLLTQMASDGVTDVIYAFYPDPQLADVLTEMDALRPLIQQVCEASAVPCHWLDLRPVFAGNYETYIQTGGLNPTAEGARATAEAIWALMQAECIAQ